MRSQKTAAPQMLQIERRGTMRTVKAIGPLDAFLWTFRRSERDVIRLYDALSGVMTLATGGRMINFGLWDDSTRDPIAAQDNLCDAFAGMARLQDAGTILDVGCGYAAPAVRWHDSYDSEFVCVNINLRQMRDSRSDPGVAEKSRLRGTGIRLVNATATRMPFADRFADRVLAFESPQHFRPLEMFLAEAWRTLKPGGMLAMALPVVSEGVAVPLVKLGLLAMTWSSEHYTAKFVTSLLERSGFEITRAESVGPRVYRPLADYYSRNRDDIRRRLLSEYPGYVEAVLDRSMRKMARVSDAGVIEYLMVSCRKGPGTD